MSLDLSAILRPDQVSVTQAVRELHSKGESFDAAVMPDLVAYPETTEEVAAVMRAAYEAGVAVTPVGANSSLEGHTVPLRGGLSLEDRKSVV